MKNRKILLTILTIIIFFITIIYFIKINNNKTSVINNEKVIKIEDKIKISLLREYPYLDEKVFDLDINESLNEYTRGSFILNDNRLDNKKKCFWFATKINSQWNIIDYRCNGYFGLCQDFREYNFPLNMTPDCWDNEKKILINTTNPEKFYNGLTFEDKENIKKAFLEFKKEYKKDDNKEIFIKFDEIIDNYIKGVVLFSGIENYSAQHFFAVKDNDNWKVLYYGQEDPMCKDIENYNFPIEVIPGCWKTGSEWVKRE